MFEGLKERLADVLHAVANRLDGGSWAQAQQKEGHFQGLKEGRASWQQSTPERIETKIEISRIEDSGGTFVQMTFYNSHARAQYLNMLPEDAAGMASDLRSAALGEESI